MLSINLRVTIAFVITVSLVALTLGQSSPRRQTPPAVRATTPTPATRATTIEQPSPARPQTRPAMASTQAPTAPDEQSSVQPQPARVRVATPVAAAAPAQEATAEPQAQPRPTTAQTPSAAPRSPDYVEEKGFKGRVFEVKYRDPDGLSVVLRPLGSGFKGAALSTNREFRTITVRDFPENIAAMEEAIKRLDVAEAPSPDIEFTVHVLIASGADGPASDLPAELGSVLKQLQSTLKYKNYNLMTSAIHRGKEGPNRLSNSGVAESKLLGMNTPQGSPIFYNYNLGRISLEGAASSSTRVQVGDFSFMMRVPLVTGADGKIQYENVGFNTPVAVREGEKVVVGTTSMGDKGLIVVLLAKVLK